MSYKSVTICLDSSKASTRFLDYAVALCSRHNAHLTGLHLIYSSNFYFDPYGQWATMMAEVETMAEKKRDMVKETFRTVARRSGVGFSWMSYRTFDFEQTVTQARASDLTIIGQRNPDDIETELGNGFVEKLVMRLGRPVLFLPHSAPLPASFDHIMVAWDGGREAARAMADAMPLLRQAKRVTVLSISKKMDLEHDLPDVDIGAYLAKHEVNVEVERNEDIDVTPAEWLLFRTEELKADLLVMGAYGHSRVTELILGGTTRSVMQKMRLPVLMSH